MILRTPVRTGAHHAVPATVIWGTRRTPIRGRSAERILDRDASLWTPLMLRLSKHLRAKLERASTSSAGAD